MSDARLALVQTRYALLSTFRTPRAVILTMAFPVIFLVLFNSIFTESGDTTTVAGHTITAAAYFTGGLIAYAMALTCFTQPLVRLTAQRERGQLKRLRGTPMPAWTFVAAQVLRSASLAFGNGLLMLAISVAFYDVSIPARTLPALVIYLALGTACFCALGIAMTAFTTTEDSASAIGPFSVVMLAFVSGVWIPIDTLPGWLQEVGRVFPLSHLAEGLQTTLARGTSGIGLSAGNVAVLALWGLAGVWIAARRFHWEPQANGG